MHGLTILRVDGQMAASSNNTELETFRSAVAKAIARGCSQLAVNLESVKFMDARGLGELAQAFVRTTGRGSRFVLIAPAGRLRELLHVTRLDSVLPVVASEQEAVERFTGTMPTVEPRCNATLLEAAIG